MKWDMNFDGQIKMIYQEERKCNEMLNIERVWKCHQSENRKIFASKTGNDIVNCVQTMIWFLSELLMACHQNLYPKSKHCKWFEFVSFSCFGLSA